MSALLTRDIDILSLLISEYISTATPVASVTIAKQSSPSLSPATIRNVLAKLEDIGLLSHPHTSAGRVPTPAGLRFYVNTILSQREISEDERTAIEAQFKGSSASVEEVLKRTGKILSLVSNYTGLVVMPKPDQITFKYMEFLPLSTGKILGIFVSREGLVHNRVIDIGEDFSYPDMEKISNYCNNAFYGCTLEDAISKALKEYEEKKSQYDRLISRALLWSKEIFGEAAEDDLLVEGKTKLFSAPEFAEVEKLKTVMDALEEKKGLVHILNRAAEGDEVGVFIGTESNYAALADCSIVTSSYKKGGKIVGTLGVIGPTRMNYSQVIPTVDFTAKIVSGMLEG